MAATPRRCTTRRRDVLLSRGVLVPCLHVWKVAGAMLPELLGPDRAARSAGHGADPLFSVAMHLFPELARLDLIPPGPALPRRVGGLEVVGFGIARLGGIEIGVPVELGDSAVTADARLCSAATGAAITQRLVEAGAALVAHLARQEAGGAGGRLNGRTGWRPPKRAAGIRGLGGVHVAAHNPRRCVPEKVAE